MNTIKLIIATTLILASANVFAADRTFNLKFSSGKISSTVENAIVRGDRDIYRFTAGSNRSLSVAITAFENNATVAIFYRRNSKWVVINGAKDTRAWHGKLPKSESNRYKIEVGGTRGNASYEMFAGISVTNH